MSLRDEITSGKIIWSFDRVCAALDDEERGQFLEALADPDVVPYRIWQALLRRKIDVSSRPVYEWCKRARRDVR